MSAENGKNLILRAWNRLERVTPLKTDCGVLCSFACCRGDSETGMYLFPFERELLEDKEYFKILDCRGNSGYPMVVCNGECERRFRPLACRVFPYFPVINDDGTFDARRDPRATQLCPLLSESIAPEYVFTAQVRRVARILCQNDELRHYVIGINEMLDDIESLSKRLL